MVTAVGISGGVFGILGDMFDSNYKKRSTANDKLESYLLSFANDFDFENLVEDFDGGKVLSEKTYENKILPILTDYEEFSVYDGLSHELARRDFDKTYSKSEINKMAKKNGNYFGAEMYDFEKKYWDEFDKNGYDRLEIKEDTDKNRRKIDGK
ncbi:MAG: hypothetical protein NTW79_01610 [Candidatus Berkelbacteria bacterium]|nr:hypothetical protein [Candidatus Berkelbacteria bacterium]